MCQVQYRGLELARSLQEPQHTGSLAAGIFPSSPPISIFTSLNTPVYSLDRGPGLPSREADTSRRVRGLAVGLRAQRGTRVHPTFWKLVQTREAVP